MVGRKPSVSKEDAKNIIKRFMHHFQNGQLPASSDEVWKEMSRATEKKWSPEACFLYLRYDRNFCLSEVKRELGIVDPPALDENCNLSLEETFGSNDRDVSFESSSDVNNNSAQLDAFDLVVSEMQWKSITTEKNGQLILKPRVWANDISTMFWQQFRLPCAYVMKRGGITSSHDGATCVVEIIGSCKSKVCGNNFYGHAEKKSTIDGLTIIIKTRDTRNDNHEIVKRPLNGERRKAIQKELKADGTSVWRKRYARENMRPGETAYPLLPSGDVCRNARKEQIDDELGVDKDDGKDIIGTISGMKHNPQHAGLIHEVGSDPFFVTYSSPAQLYAYKEYCRIVKNSVLVIDATGSVAQKLKRGGQTSGHIFLYSMVINFEKTTIAVHQVLSETHTTTDIEFWLRKWTLKLKAPKPKQTVSDYCRALLCGISLAFNNVTIKSYIDMIFRKIVKDGAISGVATVIRVDVAHFIHAVCRWKCWQSVRQAPIKNFYVRCVALMVECTTLRDFQEIFHLTCVVGLQCYQDTDIIHSEVQTTKEAMNRLETYIAARGIDIDTYKESSQPEDKAKYSETEDISEPEEDLECSSISAWVDEQVTNAGCKQQEGKELNPFYLPEFVKLFTARAKEFPLWTSVGMENGTAGHATSSYVEGYFSELKNRVLKHVGRPLRLDKFLKLHVQDIAGATLLFSSTMLNFNANKFALNNETETAASISASSEKTEVINSGSNAVTSRSPRQHRLVAPQSLHDITNLDTIEQRTNSFETKSSSEVHSMENVHHLQIPSAAEACNNDSDLVSSEDWRGKGTLNDLNCSDVSLQQLSGFSDISSNDCDDLTQGLTSSILLKMCEDFQSENLNGSLPSSDNVFDGPQNLQSVTVELKNQSLQQTPLLYTENSIILEDTEPPMTDTTPILTSSGNDLNDSEQPIAICDSQLVKKSSKRLVGERDSRKVSKYFRPCPEIKHTNTLVSMKKKSVLLKNGSICSPIRIPGRSGDVNAYFIQKTCAFDALVHVLMTAAIDDVNYFNFLKISKNRTLQLVCNLIEKGVTSTVFRDRLFILKSLYPCEPQMQTERRFLVHVIDATDSIANAAKSILATEPSVQNVENCSHCKGAAYGTTVLAPNHKTVNRGFGYLQSALNFDSPLYRVQCRPPCVGKFTWTKEPCNHVIIELDIRATDRKGEMPKTGKKCRLNEMPVTLQLKHGDTISIYRLAGVVARFPDPDHFVAYCLRSTGVWQVFDDLQKAIGTAAPKFIIESHLAVYVRFKQITEQ